MRVRITPEGKILFDFDPEGEKCRRRASELLHSLREAGVDVKNHILKPHGDSNVSQNNTAHH